RISEARPHRVVERRNIEASRLGVTGNGAAVIEGRIPVPALQYAGLLGQRSINSSDNPEGIDVLPEVSGAKLVHPPPDVGQVDAEGIVNVVGRSAGEPSGIPCEQWLRCQRLAALAIHVGTFDIATRGTAKPDVSNAEEGDALLRRHQIVLRLEVVA